MKDESHTFLLNETSRKREKEKEKKNEEWFVEKESSRVLEGKREKPQQNVGA